MLSRYADRREGVIMRRGFIAGAVLGLAVSGIAACFSGSSGGSGGPTTDFGMDAAGFDSSVDGPSSSDAGADVASDAVAAEAGEPEAGLSDGAVTCPVAGQVAVVSGLTDAGAGQTSLTSLAVDSINVYAVLTNEMPMQDQVLQVPLAGGAPVVLVSGGFVVTQLASDGTFVYLNDMADVGLERVPVGGGTAQGYSSPGSPSDFDLVGSTIYAVGSYPTGANSEAVEIWSQPAGVTTGAAVIAQGFLATGSSETLDQRIGVSGGTAFFSLPTNGTGTIQQSPLDGGAGAPLVTGLPGPQAMTVAAGQVFWTTSTGELHAIPQAGGTDTTLATNVNSLGLGTGSAYIVSDGTSVYYGAASATATLLEKIPVGGGVSTVVGCFANTSGQGTPIALDATFAYWTDGQTIWKAPK
jgi:hypothetical protein